MGHRKTTRGTTSGRPYKWIILMAMIFLLMTPTLAQRDNPPPPPDDDTVTVAPTEPPRGRTILDDVWVTTQDRVNLRLGPGRNWDVLTVVPNNTTLQATGRTAEGDWIQVAWEEPLEEGVIDAATIDGVTYGWIIDWLLVWSGDILTLPVDGVETVSFARRVNPTITIGPGTLYYRDGVDPSTQVAQTITEPTEVELTGRIGEPVTDGYYWIQFRLEGEYFWTATWETGNIRSFRELPDGAYIYTYGRLLIQLRNEINRARGTLSSIGRRWRNLANEGTTSCNNIPADAALDDNSFSQADLNREPVYVPSARALLAAIDQINAAIARFRDVCSGTERIIDPEEVRLALIDLDEAERNLNLALLLLDPIERRDPLLGNVPQGQ